VAAVSPAAAPFSNIGLASHLRSPVKVCVR
jgi:hypothetical protein